MLEWDGSNTVMPGLNPGITRTVAGSPALHISFWLRRSACQTPLQAPLPPLHEPPPLFPARWPVPVAVLSPALTLTTTAPFLPTLPVMLTVAVPALPKVPLVMRIG